MGDKKKIKAVIKGFTVICGEREKIVIQGQNVRVRDRYMQVEAQEETSVSDRGSTNYLCYRLILSNGKVEGNSFKKGEKALQERRLLAWHEIA